jgi:REP element-mobilizing transposase RayT
MTQPRVVLPGATVLVTRRCILRTQLLRPDAEVRAVFLYCLGVMAERHGVRVHAFVVMSNHYHLVATDVRGTLPDFLRELHRLLALCVKSLRRWDDAVWDGRPASVVHLRTPQAVLEKLAYVIANPVAAGAVERARQWPGLVTLPSQLGAQSYLARRPARYFDPKNPRWPEHQRLTLSMPKVAGLRPAEVREAVARQVAELERQARAELRRAGWKVRGAERCASASPYERAQSPAPPRDRDPTFAVGRGQHEAHAQAVRELRAFRAAYAEALARWRRGDRRALFPPGTWRMRVLHAAPVADLAA